MKKLPYNFLYLKYFCDAARLGSISKAAIENHISQSAVSQGIAKLEESLGQELIVHQPNTFRLTSFGERLSQKSRELFSTIRTLEEELIGEEGELKRVAFASMHSLALKILPRVLKKASKLWPQLEVIFRLAHTDGIMDMVKRGQVDFGFVLDNEDLSSFQCREILRGEYGLYAAKTAKNINKLPFILSEERKEIIALMKSYKKQFGKEPKVLMEISSWEVIARLVEEGLGIGFFPDYVAQDRAKLKKIDLKLEHIPYRVLAIFPRNIQLTKNLENFLSLANSKSS
jgi:DNA-binding transcriptional LysR family regulator